MNLAVVNLAVVNLAVVNLAVVNLAVVNLAVVNLAVVNLAGAHLRTCAFCRLAARFAPSATHDRRVQARQLRLCKVTLRCALPRVSSGTSTRATMARKNLYPPEPDTKRDRRPAAAARQSGAAPKSDRERSEAPTEPPPGRDKAQGAPPQQRTQPSLRRPSDARAADPPTRRGLRRPRPSAAVDEVVADMSKDPRRERDDDA